MTNIAQRVCNLCVATNAVGEAMGREPGRIGGRGEGKRKRKEKEVGVQKMRKAGEIERNHAIMLKF